MRQPREPRLKLYRGIWCVVWTERGNTRRHSLGTADEDEAKRRWLYERRQVIGKTCQDIFDKYIADRRERVRFHGRLAECWKHLAPACGHLFPEHITRVWCRAYVKQRQALGRSNGTIIKELSVLSAALHWADKRTPAIIEKPPMPPPRTRYLTREECARLIEAAASPHVQLFIILGLTTGGRREALLQLPWSRVDFKRGLIALGDGAQRTKGRATVPLHPDALPYLEAARKAARTPFVIEWADRPVTAIRTGFKHACKIAGLEKVSPNVLRHTAAVMMAESGASMAEIATYLGHSDDHITQRVYARFSPEYLKRAAKGISWAVHTGPKLVHGLPKPPKDT